MANDAVGCTLYLLPPRRGASKISSRKNLRTSALGRRDCITRRPHLGFNGQENRSMSASSLATNASSYLPLQDSVCPQVGVRLFDGVQEGVGARTSIDDKTAVQRCNVDEQRARASSQQQPTCNKLLRAVSSYTLSRLPSIDWRVEASIGCYSNKTVSSATCSCVAYHLSSSTYCTIKVNGFTDLINHLKSRKCSGRRLEVCVL